MTERHNKQQTMMEEIYQASHQDLYNLCIVLGSMITYRNFEEKGMGSVREHGEQMTDNLIKMLVGNLKEIRQG